MTPSALLTTSLTLLQRVQADEPRAWDQFVELYGPLLFYWARRAGLSSADAADVTQEAFTAIFRNIARFEVRRDNGSLRGWMLTIVRNKLIDFGRQQQNNPGAGGTELQRLLQEWPEQLPADPESDEHQNKALLHRALSQVEAEFEPHTWSAFWKVVVDGGSTSDVAAELGLSTASVRQAKSRVLRRLREHLEGWFDDPDHVSLETAII